ncbi:MAG: glycosyltransferase family 4 protein [Pseudomonadota bacterium]
MDILDIAPRWRNIHDLSPARRVVGGGTQLLRDVCLMAFLLLFKRPAIVHVTTPGGMAVLRDLAMIILARLLLVPVVYHVRFGKVPALLTGPRSVIGCVIKCVFRLVHQTILIDAATYDAVRAAGFESAVLIPNCYDDKKMIAGSYARKKQVVFIGWVIPTKGVQELVDAWVALGASDWTLKFVGPAEPEYESELGKRTSTDGAAIEFVGALPHKEVVNVLASSEILILPSYTEGFPNVVLEGMAMGCAVIGTSVGAIPEMLADGAGEVIPPRNVQAIVAALHRLIDNPEARRSMGDFAQRRAKERYSLESVFGCYMKLWKSLA